MAGHPGVGPFPCAELAGLEVAAGRRGERGVDVKPSDVPVSSCRLGRRRLRCFLPTGSEAALAHRDVGWAD